VAEDLAADVFVRAIGGIKGYAWRGTPLLAWLYRIAHNEPEEMEEPRDELRAFDDRSEMLQAIRALTEDQQQVIILRFYHGMRNAEVAKIVGKPEGAVKALQTRGLRSLRRILTEGIERRKSA
jgi:RNA polymerase sigma-70 factor (ECF subfamily)